MPSKKHDDIAKRISKEFYAEYNKVKCADISTYDVAVVVNPVATTA